MHKITRLALSLVLVGGLAAACSDDSADDGGDDTTTTTETGDTTTTEGSDDSTTTTEGGGGGEDEDAYVTALAGVLGSSSAGWSEDETTCMAAAIIDVTGADRWADAGVTPEDIENVDSSEDSPGQLLGAGAISDDEADEILDGWDDCADINAKFADSLRGGEVDDAAVDCIEEGLDDSGAVREGFKQTFTEDVNEPGAEILAAIIAVFEDCGLDPNA